MAIVSARGEGGNLTDFRRLSNTELTLFILMGIDTQERLPSNSLMVGWRQRLR